MYVYAYRDWVKSMEIVEDKQKQEIYRKDLKV